MSFLPDKPVIKYKLGGIVQVPQQDVFTTTSTSGDKTMYVPKKVPKSSVIEEKEGPPLKYKKKVLSKIKIKK